MDIQKNKEDISELVANYKLSDETIDLVKKTPIVLLVGISGAGKDTIKHRLLETGDYHHIVSHTTRSPRENAGVLEQDGADYHFISHDIATQMLQKGEYVEAKKYGDNIYGTSSAEIAAAQQTGKIAITDLEVQGVAEYKEISSNVIALFILPPTFSEWQRRLQSRYGDKGADPLDMAKRMATAILELEEALSKPYYHFIINDDLETAINSADKIAHNHDEFTKVDDTVHEQAQKLLTDLRASLKA